MAGPKRLEMQIKVKNQTIAIFICSCTYILVYYSNNVVFIVLPGWLSLVSLLLILLAGSICIPQHDWIIVILSLALRTAVSPQKHSLLI